jgi:hypothetical protein
MQRKDVAESGFSLGGGGNARALLVHPGHSWKVNIRDPKPVLCLFLYRKAKF